MNDASLSNTLGRTSRYYCPLPSSFVPMLPPRARIALIFSSAERRGLHFQVITRNYSVTLLASCTLIRASERACLGRVNIDMQSSDKMVDGIPTPLACTPATHLFYQGRPQIGRTLCSPTPKATTLQCSENAEESRSEAV